MNATSPVLAAGAVVWRQAESGVDVLLVHRPRYDDWSYPKGKLDPGEHLLTAAVREVAEETGLTVRLGAPLPQQEYVVDDGVPKVVHYWAARAIGDDDVDGFRPNKEIDQLAWVGLADARRRLTYQRDLDVLRAFADSDAQHGNPLILLRHAHARPRESWSGADWERPLSARGEVQALALVPLLEAYGVSRIVSSNAVRCATTVEPYADETGAELRTDHRFSEEGADYSAVARRLRALLSADDPVVVCSHRKVLPMMFEALGVAGRPLHAGAFLVVHHDGGKVHATEHHQP